MKFARLVVMKIIDELEEEILKLEREIQRTREENIKLQDDVDSLWAMMDEITKSDIENFSHLLDEIKADVITRALMVTKKKVDC